MKNILKSIAIFSCLALPFVSSAQSKWIGELNVSSLDCKAKEVCYNVNIRGNQSAPWALGDQNYRLFYDAANVSVLSVKSLLPAGPYGSAQIREVLEIVNQGQEDYSPLDVIDQNLGFLDFSILAYAKENPEAAVKLTVATPMPVAEVCFSVSEQMLQEGQENAMNIYFSRPETSGLISNQYTVISEIDAINHTKGTKASAFSDISYHVGADAQLAALCELSSAEKIGMRKNTILTFPNPVGKGGTISYKLDAAELEGEHIVSIYNLTGELMSTYENLPTENNQIQLDEKFAPGSYFMKIQFDTRVVNASFTVVNQ